MDHKDMDHKQMKKLLSGNLIHHFLV